MDLAIPDPWPALVLVFGAYRITRLLGWDDWPPILRVRQWAIGEQWVLSGSVRDRVLWADARIADAVRDAGFSIVPPNLDLATLEMIEAARAEVELPGKQSPSEVSDVRPAYSRPTLAHLVHCPFCLGWWVSLATYAAWNVSAGWTLWLIAPFALSGAVGLVARNLDP